MSLAPKRFLLTEKVLANWLGIKPRESIAQSPELIATRVLNVLCGLSNQSWLAVEPSILDNWLTDFSDLELSGIYRKIVGFLRKDQVRDFSQLCQTSPGSWANLPEELTDAEQNLITNIDFAYLWCEPGTERLEDLRKQLAQLFQGFSVIDIYDPYLIHNLSYRIPQIDKSLKAYQRNRYVQTLNFICDVLTSNGGQAKVNLKCPIRAERQEELYQLDSSDVDSIYRLLPGLKALLYSMQYRHNGKIKFELELRTERPVRDHGRADMSGEWLHGRFIVLPGACVVSSDRSMDFVGFRYLSDGGTGVEKLALLDNLLVRWSPRILAPDEISRRWSALIPIFSGQGLITADD